MMAYVANFARTGNPNGTGLPVWNPWSNGEAEPKHIILDVDDDTQALNLTMSSIELSKPGVESAMAGDPLCEEIKPIFENWYSFLSWNVPCIHPCEADFSPSDGDVDGSDLAWLVANPDFLDLLSTFAAEFGRIDCSQVE